MKHSVFFHKTEAKTFVQTDFNSFADRLARIVWGDDERIVQWFGDDGVRLRRECDFDSSDNAFFLRHIGAGEQFRGGDGLKPLDKFFPGKTLQFRANLLVRFAAWQGIASKQGIDIERCAACDDYQTVA